MRTNPTCATPWPAVGPAADAEVHGHAVERVEHVPPAVRHVVVPHRAFSSGACVCACVEFKRKSKAKISPLIFFFSRATTEIFLQTCSTDVDDVRRDSPSLELRTVTQVALSCDAIHNRCRVRACGVRAVFKSAPFYLPLSFDLSEKGRDGSDDDDGGGDCVTTLVIEPFSGYVRCVAAVQLDVFLPCSFARAALDGVRSGKEAGPSTTLVYSLARFS